MLHFCFYFPFEILYNSYDNIITNTTSYLSNNISNTSLYLTNNIQLLRHSKDVVTFE